jgi:hypothetical protein
VFGDPLTGRKLAGAACGVIALMAMAVTPGGLLVGQAATPASGTIDGSKTVEWDSPPVAGAGLGGTPTPSTCAPGTCDKFDLNIVLPAADTDFYSHYKAQLSFHYTWTSTTPDDMDIFAFDPTGAQAGGPGTPDDQTTGAGVENLVLNNPMSGHWTIESAAGVTVEPTPAHTVAKLTITPLPPVKVTQVLQHDSPKLTNYAAPVGYQTVDSLQRQNAGEPNIGADWKTGALMYMAGTQISKVTFDDTRHPATATWKDVTPVQQQFINEDQILYTDHDTNRTFAVGLLLACSNISFSDDSGATWSQGTGCPIPHSPDHESLASGPPAKTATFKPTGSYPSMVYYCSQNIVQSLGAFCGHSQDGGVTFTTPSTQVFGTGTPCGAIHGHIRVSPDGTVYIPQRACDKGVGMAVSRDNGQTYSYSVVTDSTPGNGDDPSVAAGADNTVYYGYDNADGYPMIAVSHDHGKTWAKSINVGTPFGVKNTEFPEVWAGDGDRAAFAFLGSSTPGSTQSSSFTGAWYMYVSYTYDGGRTWTTVNATPGDPVQRGCIWNGGGTSACRNMLDFNEITVDKFGRVAVAYTDGCSADCETNPKVDTSGCPVGGQGNSEIAPEDSTPTCTYGRHSSIVRQTCGKGLFAKYDGMLGDNCYPGTQTTSAQPNFAGVEGAQGSGGMPNTSRAPIMPNPWAIEIAALIGAAAFGLTAARRRRRSR